MRNALLLFVALVALFASTALAAENWPQFRGPEGDGMTDETGLPLSWSESENVKWKTAIHGKAWSSPVIWDDQIWMTTAPEDGKQLYAVCVDRDSGRIVHDIKVFDIAEPQFCIEMNSYASPTPVAAATRKRPCGSLQAVGKAWAFSMSLTVIRPMQR